MNKVDLIIVGGGSAGCIIANQIVRHTNLKVLLIEAGPFDRNPIIKIPLGYGMTFYNKKLNWNFYSENQNNLFSRKIYFPRGKVIGGSGSINAMVYTRGLQADYINWENQMNDYWSLTNIMNAYDQIEKKIKINYSSKIINKISVNDVSDSHHPILQNFFKSSERMGVLKNKNLNTNIINQVGHYNINTKNGYRFTSSDGFLKPVLNHQNLKIITNAQVKKIIFDNNKKVSEIKIIKNKKIISIKTNLGVILSAGAIMTPHLLMHSGIGPANDLKKFNIKAIIDSPNVGKNLQDHIGIDYLFKTNQDTLNKSLGRWPGRLKSVINYLYNRTGPLSLSLNQSGGYINWKSRNEFPNIQLYFNPITYSINYKNKRPLLKTDKFNGFAIGFNACRPKSRGSIFISSSNFEDLPKIDPNYLEHPDDIHDLKCAFDFIRKLSNQKEIREITKEQIDIDILKSNDEELIEHFKKNATSVYHPCGTCRMGESINKGVVSNKLKVHGLKNLWVLDASVFPNITSGNINGPVMMTAYIGSKLIIDDLNKNN